MMRVNPSSARRGGPCSGVETVGRASAVERRVYFPGEFDNNDNEQRAHTGPHDPLSRGPRGGAYPSEAMMEPSKPTPTEVADRLAALLRRGLDQVLYFLAHGFSFLRHRTEDTRHQLKEVFYSTSDQVLEKAEETRKSVKLRMAILEIEHHLNRLYPQIGKIACDLAAERKDALPDDADLRAKVELAEEYRGRLGELRQQLEARQQRDRTPQPPAD